MYTNKPSILLEAEGLVGGDRQESYGDPQVSFERAAKIASQMCGYTVTAKDVVCVMVALKLSRESHKHKRDNLVDACGYLELLNRLS